MDKLFRRKLKSQKKMTKKQIGHCQKSLRHFRKNICKVVDGYKLENSKCYSQMMQDLKLEMRLRKRGWLEIALNSKTEFILPPPI